MTDSLTEQYPEAAPYIGRLSRNGEDWVIEHYHPKLTQLGVIMDTPGVEELPFYDADVHDAMTDDEQREYYDGLAAYKENLRTGIKLGTDEPV